MVEQPQDSNPILKRITARANRSTGLLSPWVQRFLHEPQRGETQPAGRRSIAFISAEAERTVSRAQSLPQRTAVWRADQLSLAPNIVDRFVGDVVDRFQMRPIAVKQAPDLPDASPATPPEVLPYAGHAAFSEVSPAADAVRTAGRPPQPAAAPRPNRLGQEGQAPAPPHFMAKQQDRRPSWLPPRPKKAEPGKPSTEVALQRQKTVRSGPVKPDPRNLRLFSKVEYLSGQGKSPAPLSDVSSVETSLEPQPARLPEPDRGLGPDIAPSVQQQESAAGLTEQPAFPEATTPPEGAAPASPSEAVVPKQPGPGETIAPEQSKPARPETGPTPTVHRAQDKLSPRSISSPPRSTSQSRQHTQAAASRRTDNVPEHRTDSPLETLPADDQAVTPEEIYTPESSPQAPAVAQEQASESAFSGRRREEPAEALPPAAVDTAPASQATAPLSAPEAAADESAAPEPPPASQAQPAGRFETPPLSRAPVDDLAAGRPPAPSEPASAPEDAAPSLPLASRPRAIDRFEGGDVVSRAPAEQPVHQPAGEPGRPARMGSETGPERGQVVASEASQSPDKPEPAGEDVVQRPPTAREDVFQPSSDQRRASRRSETTRVSRTAEQPAEKFSPQTEEGAGMREEQKRAATPPPQTQEGAGQPPVLDPGRRTAESKPASSEPASSEPASSEPASIEKAAQIRPPSPGGSQKVEPVNQPAVSRAATAKTSPPEKRQRLPLSSPPARLARSRLIRRGWRFKRKAEEAPGDPVQVGRAVDRLDQSAGQGRPLPAEPRQAAEQALGRDFSAVRVQTASLRPLNVEAATQGRDVYVEPGQDRFDTPRSLAVLSHELTHVARRGLVQTKPAAEMAVLSQTWFDDEEDASSAVRDEENEAIQVEQRVLQQGASQKPDTASPRPVFRRAAVSPTPPKAAAGGAALPDVPEQVADWLVTQERNERYPLVSPAPPQLVSRQEAVEMETPDAGPESEAKEETQEQTAEQPLDLDQLARQIYPLLKRMLAVEQERRPDYRDFSFR